MQRVLKLAWPAMLAVGLTIPGSVARPAPASPPGPAASVSSGSPVISVCADLCTMIYEPVTCKFSDDLTRSFPSMCQAERYACRNNLRIISCGARRPAAR